MKRIRGLYVTLGAALGLLGVAGGLTAVAAGDAGYTAAAGATCNLQLWYPEQT